MRKYINTLLAVKIPGHEWDKTILVSARMTKGNAKFLCEWVRGIR